MSLEIMNESVFWLYCFLTGIAITVVYDLLRIIRRVVRHPYMVIAMEDIVFWIGKARIWYLQNFKDSGSILSPNLVNMEPFSENELELFANTANESKLNTVVRNV